MFVILGANGNTGSVAAKTLLSSGRKVRAVVRDEAKGAPLAALGAEVVVADAEDTDALKRALAGASGAYLLSPPDARATDFLGERKRLFARFAEAAKYAKVPHLVLLSSIGAQHASGTGIVQTVAAGEVTLRETGIPLTAVRPAYFIENWLAVLGAAKSDGILPSFIAKDQSIEMVATPDIGRTVAQALLDGARGKRVIELAGPAPASPNAVAAAFSRVLGRSVAVVEAPLEAVVPTFASFGLSADIAELYRQLYEGVANGRVDFEGGEAELVRGTTSVEQRLRELIA